METPETRYAWNGDISLAYQVVGDGPVDLLYLQGYSSQVDMNWESPYLARFLRGLTRHSRLIITDRRGWGCSERFSPTDIPDVDDFTDDIIAILDAVGSTRAAIFASFESTIVASLFAAAHPERTAALILVDPFATYCPTDETPWMPTVQEWEMAIEQTRAGWGTSAWTEQWADARERGWFTRYMRASMSPGSLAAEVRRYQDVDIRALFPTIQVPTLFTDIVGSTEKAATIGDGAWRELLERHHETVRALIGRYRGTEINTSGDGFLATFDGPARGVKCAQAIVEAVQPLGLEIRAGLHTGEVETIDGNVGGIAVHIGARVGALAGSSEVVVSQTVKDLVAGSGLTFEDRGEHELKGVPDRWRLYRVVGT